LFFGLLSIGSVIGGITILYSPDHIDYKVFLILSSFLSSFAFSLNGPNKFLPDSLILMGIGNVITGYSSIYQSCLSITEMVKTTKEMCPNEKEKCGDYCAAIYNTSLGIGQTLGPIYGAYFT